MSELPGIATVGDTVVKLNYRPDVDGLRAIAVLSVIVFHINKDLLPGGFVGVDIFFVISGFLISLNILREIERGHFSIAEFYRRRVKRIAPPMLVVVVLTLTAAQLVMTPEDAERVADSALWSLFSLANVYFWRNQDTGYFASAANELPLLHLWSLGVEEQFYFLWPLLLLLAYRRRRATAFFVLASGVALASFALAEFWFARDPLFVYFMLPTRAGELLLGALVAVAVLRGVENRLAHVAGPIAATGLLLVIASVGLLAEDKVFPGLRAIPPTLGAAMSILGGHCAGNRVSTLLAFRPMVWVGLVSYSAYLWHWPLLAFFRYGRGEIGATVGVVAFALTFCLAWLTYRYIERPARSSRASAARVFVVQYAAPAGAIAVLALVAMYLDGYGLRWQSDEYNARRDAIRDRTRPAYEFDYVCQRQRLASADVQSERCVLGAESAAPPRVILWGDSNAAHLVGIVGVFARDAGFTFRNVALGTCPPLVDDPAPYVTARRLSDCRSSSEPILAAVRAADVVIISADWPYYFRRSERFFDAFYLTARSLAEAGKLVILVGKVPVIPGYDRRCRERALSYPLLECPLTASPPIGYVVSMNDRLREFAEGTPNVLYFDVGPYLCQNGICSAFDAKGKPLYYDRNHLSLPASWEIGEMIVRQEGVPAPFTRIVDWLQKGEQMKAIVSR